MAFDALAPYLAKSSAATILLPSEIATLMMTSDMLWPTLDSYATNDMKLLPPRRFPDLQFFVNGNNQ